MSKAFRFYETGGPDVLRFEDTDVGDPGSGQVRIRHTAIAVNYRDICVRSGLHPVASFPSGVGFESAGVIDAVGPQVSGLAVGDRVACVCAAGGVGAILCQWAKHLGATVIGTVGSDDKAAYARAHGCDHPIVYTKEDFVERVRAITGRSGVPVVYDSVGKTTFEGSLRCLRRRGLLVSYGEASGHPDPVPPRRLGQMGSIYLTHPSLSDYISTREELTETANDLFAMVVSGKIKIDISRTYPLHEAPRAHQDLESRATTGSIVLIL